jgi:hypothetical protein
VGLKEKLEKEVHDLNAAEEYADAQLPIALGAVQVVFREIRNFLAALPAEISDDKVTLEHPLKAWKAFPFPTMRIKLRNRTVSIIPAGPVMSGAFRIDLKCANVAYALLWKGPGASINEWSIVRESPDGQLKREERKQVNEESLDEAFQSLVGFQPNQPQL